jgi:hypothetical protein
MIMDKDIPFLYRLLRLLPERNMIKSIFVHMILDEDILLELNNICPLKISTSRERNQQLIDSLYEKFLYGQQEGNLILRLTYSWWCKTYQEIFKKHNPHDLLKFKKTYGEEVYFFSLFFMDQVDQYYYEITESADVTLVPIQGLKSMKEEIQKRTELEQYVEQIKKEYSLKRNNIEKDILEKQKTKEHELRILMEEREKFLQRVKTLESENKLLHAMLKLAQTTVCVIGVEWGKEQQNRIKEKYKLKNLYCYSAVEHMLLLSNIKSDYIIFSTTNAKHSFYYKLKSLGSTLYHTSKQNPDQIFDSFIEWLKEEKYD